jgi:hypothetical protein
LPRPILDSDLATVRAFFKAHGHTHLRCRARAGAIIVESGPAADALAHIRLKKLAATAWSVDEFHHTGRWVPLPIKAALADALVAVDADFAWVLDG